MHLAWTRQSESQIKFGDGEVGVDRVLSESQLHTREEILRGWRYEGVATPVRIDELEMCRSELRHEEKGHCGELHVEPDRIGS